MRNRISTAKLIILTAALLLAGFWLLPVPPFGPAPHRSLPDVRLDSTSLRLPLFSDFDRDNKVDQAELSSHGSVKNISVSLGRSSFKLFSFDSGVSDHGRLLSGDMDSDGDIDLIWVSEYDPANFVMWLGDGRGNFVIDSNPKAHANHLEALLASEDHPRVADDSTGGSTVGLVSATNLPCPEGSVYFPLPVFAPKRPLSREDTFVRTPYSPTLRKRGPPSNLS